MTSFFCYGPLRHVPLLEIVLGRSVAGLAAVTAKLENHAVYWAKGQSFPTIRPEPGAAAVGLLIQGMSDTDLARLAFYNSRFEFDLSAVSAVTGTGETTQAQMFFPKLAFESPGGRWSLPDWVLEFGALYREAATEAMSHFGSKTDKEIVAMFPMIDARATSRLNARASQRPRSPSGMGDGNVRITQHRQAYADFFALDEYHLSFDRFDGTPSEPVKRAVFLGGDAAIVLPYDPVRDRVLLVEQFRMGPLGRGDPDLWQLEPIAGRLDAGETPEETVRREAVEEAGLTLGRIEAVAECYPSPGASSEFFYIYVGLADLPDTLSGIGGLSSEAEDIRSHLIDFDVLMKMTETFEIKNAPLALAALWLARHRELLRATA